jgi:lipid II isoglutaminyl synthase (glutamine-hydrolysing)
MRYNKYMIRNHLLIQTGKTISQISRALNRGNGSTWPGHIALKGNKNFIKEFLKDSKIKTIIVAGTNGKTTTSSLIATALMKNGYTVLQNDSGANLLNGVASTLILNTNTTGTLTQDFAIFEVDENALPQVLKQVTPDYLVLLNLFRDQLDRYGEIHTIAKKWQDVLGLLPSSTKLILNADDPQIAYLGNDLQTENLFFGLSQSHDSKHATPQAADSTFCPRCGTALLFSETIFSHLGKWECKACGLERPKTDQDSFDYYPLSGTYNKYNTHAAVLVLREIGLQNKEITASLQNFAPAFGRQETIQYQNKNVQLFLSKNPTSFNQSFATIKELKASTLLLVLNDRIPDGRDISWIWDTDLSGIEDFKHILVAGDRVYDMALRVKYEDYKNLQTFDDLEEAINTGVNLVEKNETFFILPTYSAMLDSRKILTGKKIL